jgi:amyloid beta precursor protein binding protein 1
MMSESQSIEEATTHIEAQPDAKTRRYDRQLRLWAATGQDALESSRILLLASSATSTSILKNLVLPGIGHFTILDAATVTFRDAGNNFFLEGPHSVGKSRAEEAVRLLAELNDGVEGEAVKESVQDVLDKKPEWVKGFTLVVAHNLETELLERLSTLLWEDKAGPPLVIVKSAGFLAEFFIQFHDHTVIESHSDTAPSLRITDPFPTLLEHATSLDFSKMDPTDHGHVPYVIILVRVLDDWKKSHDGNPPKTYAEKQEFKKLILNMKVKQDEENFDEAEAQAYRCWSETKIPPDISALFTLPASTPTAPAHTTHFYKLLSALQAYTLTVPPYTLPLSATLPDMRASTEAYVKLQKMYKAHAEEEGAVFRKLMSKGEGREVGGDKDSVDTFLKNCHALKVLKGKKWGAFDEDRRGLATALQTSPKETSTHLALSALSSLPVTTPITEESLRSAVQNIVGQDVDLPEEFDNAIGEIARSPTSDLPTTAAFLGGLVAQEAIKMITKQYVPINGYCVVDLVDTWTGVIA